MTTGERLESGALATSTEVIEGLNDLLQLDHDAIAAYEIAIDRLDDRDHALQIEGFKRDHEQHVADLNELIVRLGGTPKNEPHATAPLKEAIQSITAAGGDAALLAGWRTNQFQITRRYDIYAHRAISWPDEVKRLIDANALDEERHYQWVVDLMGNGKSPEIGIANRMRERFAAGGAEDVRGALEERIRTKPIAGSLVSFAIGFVLGRALR